MPYIRRSARVFVLDSRDRVLLMRCNLVADRPSAGQIWVTPGGGVADGEELHATAARELWEEVGLRVDPGDLLPGVAYIEGFAEIHDLGAGLYRDDFFFLRVDRHEVDDGNQEAFERGQINEYRWWSIAELRETDEFVVPLRMADLLADIVAGRAPAEPVVLPFHH
jgi:8-oxo-dGTP pyrophosphatase MutT (NUDIX family)